MKKLQLITFLLLSISIPLSAQELNYSQDAEPILNIYMDCKSCDVSFFAENFTLGDFVTEPAVADVHVLQSMMYLGNGSIKSSFIFIGRNKFIAFRDTVNFNIPAEATSDETRTIQLEKLKLGLVPYIMKTTEADRLSLFVEEKEVKSIMKKDSWNRWTFGLNGMGSSSNQNNFKSYNLYFALDASKITEEFKAEFYYRVNYSESKMTNKIVDADLNLVDVTIQIYHRSFSGSNLLVKSLGDHFGICGIALLKNDHPHNLELRLSTGPAMEYNVFPYSESLHKQFRFIYSIMYEYSNYIETTIYNRLQDEMWRQNLSILARYQQSWGYFDASVYGSNYLHDASRYSLGVSLSTNIRLDKISKGLSVSLNFGMGMYRDRINQPKNGASLNELLTKQRAMETDYQYNWSFGITYRFGSKQFPAVNPRFGY